MSDGFKPDSRIQQIAEAYSLDAIDFASSAFRLKLDGSDASVQHIETIATALHNQLAKADPPEEKILQFAKMLGSYIGEVFRKNHGATWGIVVLNGQEYPGLESTNSGTRLWPWGR